VRLVGYLKRNKIPHLDWRLYKTEGNFIEICATIRTSISQSQEFDFYRGHGEDLKNLLNHTNSYMSADVKEAEMLGLWNTHWSNK
jgi:hypothetical protein